MRSGYVFVRRALGGGSSHSLWVEKVVASSSRPWLGLFLLQKGLATPEALETATSPGYLPPTGRSSQW